MAARKKPLLDIVVPILAVVLTVVGAARVIHYMISGETNSELISKVLFPCRELPIVKSSRMAIIRIDDVQAYSLEDISIKMMDDAKERGIPLVLGVIPKAIDEPTSIRAYLKANLCWVEIAQHGWDHQGPTPDIPEFRYLDKASAATEIARGQVVLEELTGEKLTTFIPPLNEISDEAREAVAAAGIPIISSEGDNEFDYGATTFNFLTGKINSAQTVLHDCNAHIARTSSCVVMLHPQDFMTHDKLDPTKYQVYLDTLDSLKAAGYSFVRFKDLVK